MTETARILLENGADVNAQQQDGFSALIQAAHRNDLEMLDLCLQFGADIEQTNDQGQTALDQALADGNKEAAEFLQKRID